MSDSAGKAKGWPKVAAVVLAAGSSRRFGARNKLLVEIDGVPLVARVLAAIEAGGIGRIIVVTGHEPDRIAAVAARPGCRIVHNARHAEGIGTSIAAGVAALEADIDGVLITQGDMPELSAGLVAALAGAFVDGGGDRVVHPVLADGRQGNPVIWPRRLFPELIGLSGDQGGKRLIEAQGDCAIGVATAGRGAEIDIDTVDELAAYLAARSSQPL